MLVNVELAAGLKETEAKGGNGLLDTGELLLPHGSLKLNEPVIAASAATEQPVVQLSPVKS